MTNGNAESKENVEQKKRRRLLSWFKLLGRTSQVGLIFVLSVSVVAFAATVLWNSTHRTINPGIARYIKVEIDGIPDSFSSIKPGDSFSAAPAIRNEGSVPTTAFMKVAVPKLEDGTSAYDYTVTESWKEIVSTDNGNSLEIVYAHVDSGALTTVYPDGFTGELCDGFTLKSSITGGELYAMDSIGIELDGYLVDAEEGDDPDAVWTKLGQ